jgi:hypothetical protein
MSAKKIIFIVGVTLVGGISPGLLSWVGCMIHDYIKPKKVSCDIKCENCTCLK